MKRNIYSALALGSVLILGSCASDEPLGGGANDGKISFNVSLPGQPGTRFAEGTTVDKLYYSVFDTDGNLVMQDNQEWPKGNLTTTVTLQLVANQSYDIVFFADSKEAESKGYTYDPETAGFSVVYGQDMVNNDIFDAFVKNEKGVVADGTAKSVTLIRPFGQLNIGTDDLTNGAVEKYGLSNFSSTLSIAKDNVLSGINFLTEETTAQAEDLSFSITDFSALPADAFPVSGYSYIEMNYLLVAPTETEANLINATYTINGKAGSQAVNTLNLASTPVRQNYRTNIYGSLLTTQNSFEVTIDPAFGDPSYNIASVWDGTTVIAPETDEEGNMSVNSAAQLAGLYEVINAGNDLSGKTVTLNTDVDLAGSSKWESIGTASKPFRGTLDGNGKAVKGLVNSLFGNVDGATVKNVRVVAENPTVSALIKQTAGDVNISGVTVEGTVTGSALFSKQGASGMIGCATDGNVVIEGSVNRATIVDKTYCAGGFVGRTDNCTVTIRNSENYGDVSSTRYTEGKAAGFVGMPAYKVVLEKCVNYGNVTVNTKNTGAAGGMIGWENAGFDMTDCINNGNIEITLATANSIVLAGGLYGGSGWGTGSKNIVNCTNNGNVTGHVTSMNASANNQYQYGLYVGGLVATTSYDEIVITGCTNNGNLTAITDGEIAQSQYIGGIVGGLGWENKIEITGCTVPSSVILSGNQGENTKYNALFNDMAPGNNKNVIDSPNDANPTIKQ